MAVIVALLASVTAMPSCPAPVGERVAITSSTLPAERLGGSYRTRTGQPSRGEGYVGQLRYNWGVMLRSSDSRFISLRYYRGAIYSSSTGCWFSWANKWDDGTITGVSDGRIGKPFSPDSYVEYEPGYSPHIAGYRLLEAKEVHTSGYAWLGVWNAQGSARRSQIIAYDGQRSTVLATLPLRIGGMTLTPDLHSDAQSITLIGEGDLGRPIPYMSLTWSGR